MNPEKFISQNNEIKKLGHNCSKEKSAKRKRQRYSVQGKMKQRKSNQENCQFLALETLGEMLYHA